uniref:Uncharacterized protein n=1 Tax=Oncorhynchus tshawytscha TaxID=74940 RepID=A0A8C8BVE8_ONCTS
MREEDWPPSRRFSISTRVLTPSTTICTSSTSEKPRRSALEMSKTPPTAAVSTPPEEEEPKCTCSVPKTMMAVDKTRSARPNLLLENHWASLCPGWRDR